MNPATEDALARWVIANGDACIGVGVLGLNHTSSLRNLVVTREKMVHIVKILNGRGGNPLESGHPEAYELNLNYHCNYLYTDDNSIKMIFMDRNKINDYAFVLSRPKHSSEALHNGVAVYRLTWDEVMRRGTTACRLPVMSSTRSGGSTGSGGTLASQTPPVT